MKALLSMMILIVSALPICAQNYSLNGDAIAVGTNCVAVTPNQQWQNGSVWYNDLLDLSQPFTLEFQMNYGTVDANGADGMMFVLQTVGPNALGDDGAGMGFEGFNPSFGIEFDTYYNSDLGDISADHIAFHKNGGINHYQSTNLAGPVVANPFSQNIEDGDEHPIKITWNPVTRIVELFFDCQLRLSAQVNLVNNIFNGNTQVWWGFTGATGFLSNAQLVCVAETYEFNDNLEYTICQGESIQISANGNPDGSYSWQPVTGLSNSLLQSPVASPNVDTEYCYTYTDMCGNTTSGCIQVNVIIPPEVSAGSDDDFCEGDQFVLQGSCNQSDAVIEWTDEAGAVISTGSQLNPSVSQSGTYTITATSLLEQCISSDEVVLSGFPFPMISLDPVTNKCVYDSVIFDVGSAWQSVTWFDGSVSPTFIAHDPGFYDVTIEENNCEFDFSFEVIDIITPDVNLGEDQIFCEGETVDIDASMVVLWNTGLNNDILTVSQPGEYSAEIEWQGCYDRDTIYVEAIPLPSVNTMDDGSFCEGSDYVLDGTVDQTDILFQWTLPTGVQTSLNVNADLTVDLPGLYTLTAINTSTTCVGSDVVELTEVQLPVPDFDLLYQKCTYESAIIDVGDNWQSVVWFDGTESNTWTADDEGLYSVSIALNDCETQVEIEVVDIIPPNLNLGDDQFFCEGGEVYIDASMVVLWNTGLNDAILEVTETGFYSAALEWQGCYSRDTIYVEEIPNPTVNATNNGSFCEGSDFDLSGLCSQTDVLFHWTLPGGAETSPNASASLTADAAGVYTLTAVNTLTACAGSDEVELTEIPLPIPDFDLLIEKCSYDEATLDVGSSWESVEWFDGNTNTSWLAQAAGTYPVTIEQLGCSATVAIVVEDIVPPPINLGLDREMCLGDSVLLSAGFPVEWQGGDFSTDYMAHEEGDYVARSYLNGCFNADTISVNVVEPPNLNLPFDTTLCQGNNLILQAYFTGVWNTGEVDNALVVDQPGTYTIAVTQGPCVVQDSVVVNMLQLPFVSIGEYDRYCDGESYELTAEAENSDYYSWSTGDSTSSIVVEESMEVNVTVGNVCGTSTSSVEIVFEDCSAFIYMPTSFTPNGDGINDEYWPIASNVKSFELSVYDRWGRTVFQSNSIDDPWLGNTLDGRYFVPNGQYNYHLICTTDSGNAIERSGYITVVR